MKFNNIKQIILLITLSIAYACCDRIDETEINVITLNYTVAEKGEADGIIFYDKGEYSDGWRYIEVASEDIISESEWGCYNTPIEDARNLEIGSGKTNTQVIIDFHDNLDTFYEDPTTCNEQSNGTVTAKISTDFRQNGLDDWFLPSKEEASLMNTELHLKRLGNFDSEKLYWTSSEHDFSTAITTDFFNGDQGYLCKVCSQSTSIRVIRYF